MLRKPSLAAFVLFFSLLGASSSLARTIVRMDPGKGPVGLRTASKPLKGPTVPQGFKYLPGVDLYIVEEEGKGALEEMQREGAVEGREEDQEIVLETLPDDPMLDSQEWVLEGELFDIGAAEAWEVTTGGSDVVVAIIDTGIDLDHPDLEANLWYNGGEIAGNGIDDDGNGYVDDVNGFDFWDGNPDVQDHNNHGTHLAGVIGAVGGNGIGIAGINWNVRLMPLKFTDDGGTGTTSGAIQAIDYAIRNGAQVINASWTLKVNPADGAAAGEDSALKSAIEKAGAAGILFVTAAGNQFRSGVGLNVDEAPVYPARFDSENLVAVGAVASGGGLASYSNFGPASVDLAAPGSGILSTITDQGYGSLSGTSIATAFVTGAAALLLSVNDTLTPVQMRASLEESVVPSDDLAGLIKTGGVLNLGAAIDKVRSNDIPTAVGPTATAHSDDIPEFPAGSSGGCSLVLP